MEDDIKINRSFVSAWHPRYDETENDETDYKALVGLTSTEIREQKTLKEHTFRRILDWKSPRVKGIVRFNEFQVYEEGIRAAYDAEENKKLEALLRLYGVGAPVASTILHFMYPDSFPIIDIRTVETLYRAGRIKHSSTAPSHYAAFRSEIISILSEISPFTLRELDRSLFAYHKIHLSLNRRFEDRKSGLRRTKVPRSRDKQTIRDKVILVFEDEVGKTFAREEIIDLVVSAYSGTLRGSVIPSDYCYNYINKDPASFKLHLFESLGDGAFKCLGLDAAYSGAIYWKTEKVGQWEQGKYQLCKDPRK